MSKFFIVKNPNSGQNTYVNIESIQLIVPEAQKLVMNDGVCVWVRQQDIDDLISMLLVQGKIENAAWGDEVDHCSNCLFYDEGVCTSQAPCKIKKEEKHGE